jgi:hypothetical protein
MKKLAYGKALFLIIGILVLPSFARADLIAEAERATNTLAKVDDFILSNYTEVVFVGYP